MKEARDLGAHSAGGARRTATTSERLTQAAARASRMRHLPGAGANAYRLTAALVCPAALYGPPIQGISPSALEKLRVQAAALARSGNAGYRCVWTTIALHTDPLPITPGPWQGNCLRCFMANRLTARPCKQRGSTPCDDKTLQLPPR